MLLSARRAAQQLTTAAPTRRAQIAHPRRARAPPSRPFRTLATAPSAFLDPNKMDERSLCDAARRFCGAWGAGDRAGERDLRGALRRARARARSGGAHCIIERVQRAAP